LAVPGGAILLEARSGKLLAERAKDIKSRQAWQHASLSADDNCFYYVKKASGETDKQTLVAMSNLTNAVLWEHTVGNGACFALEPEHGDVIVAYSEEITPLPVSYAARLDGKSGELRWCSQPIGEGGDYQVFTTAYYAYVQAVGGGVTKLDASSGTSLGSRAAAGKVLVNAEGMYVVGTSEVSYIKDWAASEPAYSFSYPEAGYYIDAVLSDDAIYVVADST